jgi:hypothetical protein
MADIESPLRQMLFATMEPGKIRLCNRQTRRFYKLYPYLTNLANDISLGQLTYYNKISERSAFAGSLVILVLEKLNYVKLERQMNNFEPYLLMNLQLTVHILKIKRNILMAVAGRYIRSNLKVITDTGDASAANSFAIDVAGFYQSEELAYNEFNGRWRAGFNIQNLGPKSVMTTTT